MRGSLDPDWARGDEGTMEPERGTETNTLWRETDRHPGYTPTHTNTQIPFCPLARARGCERGRFKAKSVEARLC